ncbi:hypothetical protein Q427_17825 [Halomonas sp. BC04]|nr:hypothetical protein Q427_17825 [Halomonas sp. BC04]
MLEGRNNRIKVIKRIAYGSRNKECFFLKLRVAFSTKFDGSAAFDCVISSGPLSSS